MRAFTYERAQLARRSRGRRRAQSRRQVHRRRHQPARPDEAADRDARASDRRERPRRSTRSKPTPEGGLRIGALVRNTDLAADARVRRDYGVLSRALLAGASGQLRNKATTAGNLLQRTRCPYFYDTDQPCNKRAARQRLRGDRRLQPAASPSSASARPASPRIRATWRWPCARSMPPWRPCGPDGATRTIPIAEFHRLPGDTPHIETALEPGELITAVTLPQAARRHADLSQGARPRVVCVRAGLGRRDHSARRHRPRGARRRGAQAVARRGGRSRDAARRARRSRRGCSRARSRPHDNAFKMPLVERTLAAVLAEAKELST